MQDSIDENKRSFKVIFKDIETLSTFFQKNPIDGFQNIDQVDISLSREGDFYKAELALPAGSKKCSYSKEEKTFLHFLADAYLLKSKTVFLPDEEVNQGKFWLDFSPGKYHYLRKFFKKSLVEKAGFKFCFNENVFEFAGKVNNVFLKRIYYDDDSKRFILDYYSAPDLFLYCNITSFKKGILNMTNQGNFREILMGIITAFDSTLLKNSRIPDLLSTLSNQDKFRFFYYLTEAFISKEFEKLRRDFGFYLLRWLRLRIILSLSLKDLNESIDSYLSLLIDPEQKWVWKFVDVEKEIEWILKNPEFKKILFFELKDLKKRLFQWIGNRYSINLNLSVIK